MATNGPKDNKRIGAVKKRAQVLSPQNKRWTKTHTPTGKFMDQKYNKKPFKGVRKIK